MTWTPEFMDSVRDYLYHPPRLWEKTKIANRAKDQVQPILLAHAHDLAKEKAHFKANIERLIVSHLYLEHHFKRVGVKPNPVDMPNIVWGVYVVDKMNPEAA